MMDIYEMQDGKPVKTDSIKDDVWINLVNPTSEEIDQVQAGTLDLARVNTSALQATVDDFGVYSLPFIFTSTAQKYNVLDGEVGAQLDSVLDQYNMKNLCYLEAGSRNFYTTKKPITCVADMNGMKVRVQASNVAIKMVELLGGAATPMDYGEVYQGLQTGGQAGKTEIKIHLPTGAGRCILLLDRAYCTWVWLLMCLMQ